VVPQTDTAIREHGVDLVVERHGRTQWIEVKGWPTSVVRNGPNKGKPIRAPHAMARNFLGDLVLSALLLRAHHPDDEVAIAVPDHTTFTTLLTTISESLNALGVGVYVVDVEGGVSAGPSPS
jgi:hypothetical protein